MNKLNTITACSRCKGTGVVKLTDELQEVFDCIRHGYARGAMEIVLYFWSEGQDSLYCTYDAIQKRLRRLEALKLIVFVAGSKPKQYRLPTIILDGHT
jgi:hypothetical protein